jgi:hypothetical protein
VPGVVSQALLPISELMPIITGNSPYDGGNLILTDQQRSELLRHHPEADGLTKRLYGSRDYLNGEQRYCLWIDDTNVSLAISAFVQDKTAIERGLFDEELVPEELTVVRMGKIVKDKYPELDDEDREAVRQHAVAALNVTQQAKQIALQVKDGEKMIANTALIDGVRRFAMDVRELDIDLIDRINPFGEAYAILAKTMSEDSLKQVAAAIGAKRISLTIEEARELAKRALTFKKERGRLPSITSPDAWEKRMADAPRGTHYRRLRGNSALRRAARTRPAAWRGSRHF